MSKKPKSPKPPKISDKPNVLFVLIGRPGVGKSTFREDLITAQKSKTGFAVISTDDYVEEIAKNLDQTYDELWSKSIKDAEKAMFQYFDFAIDKGLDLIIDKTNLYKKSRAKWVQGTPDFYHKVAVIFSEPPAEILEKRLASRPGKTIPADIMQDMLDRYEPPVVSEGFDEIITVSSWRNDE